MFNVVKIEGFLGDLIISDNIAVVGNSPKMLLENRGGEIDSHDEVIRFNGALLSPWEASVGTITTVQIVAIDIAYMFSKPYMQPSKDSPERNEEVRRHNAKILVDNFGSSKFICHTPAGYDLSLTKYKRFAVFSYLRTAKLDIDCLFMSPHGEPKSYSRFYTANESLERLDLVSRLSHGGPRTGFKTVLKLIDAGVKPDLYGFDIDTSISHARHFHDDVMKAPVHEHKDHDIHGEMVALIEMHNRKLINIIS